MFTTMPQLHMCNLHVARIGKNLSLHTQMLHDFKSLRSKIAIKEFLHPNASANKCYVHSTKK